MSLKTRTVYRIDFRDGRVEPSRLQCDFCAGWPHDGPPSWWKMMVWVCPDHADLAQRAFDLHELASSLPHIHA